MVHKTTETHKSGQRDGRKTSNNNATKSNRVFPTNRGSTAKNVLLPKTIQSPSTSRSPGSAHREHKSGRRSTERKENTDTDKPFLRRSQSAVIMDRDANNKHATSKKSQGSARRKTKINFSNIDMIKVFIPNDASYRLSSENHFNILTGINIFDYADCLWVEPSAALDASLPFALYEYDVYDDSEQRIINCNPEFRTIEPEDFIFDGKVDSKPQPQPLGLFEEVPFEFHLQTVVGKPMCRLSYLSHASLIKPKCYQTPVRVMKLELFIREKKVGIVLQKDDTIYVKDNNNLVVLEILKVPVLQGGLCVSRHRPFKCKVYLQVNKSKHFFGIMGRNGSRPRNITAGPPLGFYFLVSERPLPTQDLSIYKLYILVVLVGLTTLYTEMG